MGRPTAQDGHDQQASHCSGRTLDTKLCPVQKQAEGEDHHSRPRQSLPGVLRASWYAAQDCPRILTLQRDSEGLKQPVTSTCKQRLSSTCGFASRSEQGMIHSLLLSQGTLHPQRNAKCCPPSLKVMCVRKAKKEPQRSCPTSADAAVDSQLADIPQIQVRSTLSTA